MLVLERKAEGRIKIGDDIEIVICRIKGDKVRIGIRASKETLILRGELESSPVGMTDDSRGRGGL